MESNDRASEERYGEVRAVKESIEDELLEMPGVVGVDIGYKEVGGQTTDELAIRVLVEVKRDVSPRERIPRMFENITTDVIQRGQIKFMVDPVKYDPLVGGISLGACSGPPGTGTLGAIVRDLATGQLLGLSNWHVLVAGVTGQYNIAQPGPGDGGVCPTDVIGQVTRSAINEYVDCAVVAINGRIAQPRVVYTGYLAGAQGCQYGDRVKKRGRTSGVTWGDVDTTDATITFSDAGATRTFRHQIGIWRAAGVSDFFLQPGDSGSVVTRWNNTVCALAFAASIGNPFFPDGAYAYANPISAVMSALNIAIATPPKGKEGKDGKDKEKDQLLEKSSIRKEIDNLSPAGDGVSDLIELSGADESLLNRGRTLSEQGPLQARLERLEAAVDELTHFIGPGNRPDINDGS